MPAWEDAFDRALIRARLIFLGVPDDLSELPENWQPVARELLRDLGDDVRQGIRQHRLHQSDQAFARMLIRVNGRFGDQTITQGQAERVARQVRADIAEYSQQAERIARQGVDEARLQMINGHREAAESAARTAGVEVDANNLRNVAADIRRESARRLGFEVNPEPVIRKNAKQAAQNATNFVREATGTPGRNAARAILAEWGQHPRIEAALDQVGPRGNAVRRAINRAGRAEKDLYTPGRSLYQNTSRALIHHHNEAFHEADILSSMRNPVVAAGQWKVSFRHRGLPTSPDACTLCENFDWYGMGLGVFPPGAMPSLQHTYCECSFQTLKRGPDEWEAPKPEVPKPNTISFDEAGRLLKGYVAPDKPALTSGFIRRQQQMANTNVAVAYDAWQDF